MQKEGQTILLQAVLLFEKRKWRHRHRESSVISKPVKDCESSSSTVHSTWILAKSLFSASTAMNCLGALIEQLEMESNIFSSQTAIRRGGTHCPCALNHSSLSIAAAAEWLCNPESSILTER